MADLQFRIIVYLAGFVVVSAIVWKTITYIENVGYQRAENRYETIIQESAKASLLKERELQAKVNEAIQRSADREKQHKAELAIADSANRRLRYGIEEYKRRLPTASGVACSESARAVAELFGQCSEEYQRVANAADQHANDARTCAEAWPR